MTKLRQSARGMPCAVRIEGVCNGNPETTVLAHYRMTGVSGAGLKAPDLFGAFACSACHDAIDRRAHLHLDRDAVQLAHLRGVLRTQYHWLREGMVKA